MTWRKTIGATLFWCALAIGAASASDPNREVRLAVEDGSVLAGRLLTVDRRDVLVERSSDKKQFVIDFGRFDANSQNLIENWVKEFAPGPYARMLKSSKMGDERVPSIAVPSSTIRGAVPKVYYTRSKNAVVDAVAAIRARKGKVGPTEMHQATVNELNVLRFLCGVSSMVELSADLNAKALEAAEKVQSAMKVRHDLGSHTESCNLAMGTPSLPNVIRQYFDDEGEANRDARGHRLWCLSPKMDKTGFGIVAARTSAMWVLSLEGAAAKESYAYPGKGFFPKELIYGNSWTLYLTEDAPPADELTVEVYKLPNRPNSEVPFEMAIPGERLEVAFVGTYENAINFEPSEEPLNQCGVYFVRISGGGLKEQYVVELF